ncbi:MAG: hypothetical protein U1E28_12750 [Beijerinckiaceae bacterium]
MTVKIPVNIAPQVVAAGIHGDRARITLVLVPVFNKDKAAQESPEYDLAAWPHAVERLLKKCLGFEIIPLKKDQSWRTAAIFQSKFENLEIKDLQRIGVPADVGKLNEYWRSVMGKDDGFAALKTALDPDFKSALRDPLDAALRDPESKTGPLIPDIHGTWRGKSAIELSFERAAHTSASFRRAAINTRPDAESTDALSVRVEEYKGGLSPWPKNVPRTNAYLAAATEDIDAYGKLKTSRGHADKFAAARRTYLDTSKSSSDAIDALMGAHNLLATRSPLAAAWHFGDPSNFTDKVKRKSLTRTVLNEAAAAYRLASRTPVFTGGPVHPPEDDDSTEFARRRLFTIQANPSLARLFGFVIDFECATTVLEKLVADAHKYPEMALDLDPAAVQDELPEAVKQDARFLLVRFATQGKGSSVWSTAKLRPRQNAKDLAGHFLPCTREEIDARVKNKDSDGRDLAVFGQIDGIVDLGQAWESEQRYNILSLDPVTAIGGDDATEKRRAEDKKTLETEKNLLPEVRAQLAGPRQATQRGGGLALVDRWRQRHGIERFLDSSEQRNQFDPNADPKSSNVVLDASDLTAGYKLDVGIRPNDDVKAGRNYWHTLMHRKVEYTPTKAVPPHVPPAELDDAITKLYSDPDARRDADDAQLQAPAALRDWLGDPIGMKHTTVFMEEIIGAWRGDPIGLHCGVESHQLDTKDLRIDINYSLPTAPALTPPPLRFGWGYHFGLRAAFAGGVSLPLNRALGHYEKSRDSTLAMPAAPLGGTPFLRQERIEAPTIVIPDWLFGELATETTYTKVTLKGRFPAPQASRMVVRSVDDETNRRIIGVSDKPEDQRRSPGIGFDRRVILAPAVSLDFAALHDAFRGKGGDDIETKIKMCEPRVLRDRDKSDPKDTGDDFEVVPIKGEEEEVTELTPVPEPLNRLDTREGLRQRWQKVRVAWRPFVIATRPRGGLRGIDHHAAWGGFPIFRARASVGAVEPEENHVVVPTPAPTSDEGEILHRIKGKGRTIFDSDAQKRREILWSAVGVLPGSGGSIDRSGTAVFRPLPSSRKGTPERQPYYPDPAAVTLVIQVAVRGKGFDRDERRRFGTAAVSLYNNEFLGSAPPDYPDAVPVVLDVVRGDSTQPLIKANSRVDYGRIPFNPSSGKIIPAAHVAVTLAPGDEARIQCWCVPTDAFLTHIWAGTRTMAAMAIVKQSNITDGGVKALRTTNVDEAFRKGIKSLTSLTLDPAIAIVAESKSTLAGISLPSPLQMRDFAKKMRKRMLEEPVPEIAAVTEIEAVHAVDLPLQKPKPGDGPKWQLLRADKNTIENVILRPADKCDPATQPLCASDNWTIERQQPNAVDVLIDGSLIVHGPSTAAVELRARGTAAARGRFDDVERGRSRDDRERGLWPRPDAQEPIKAQRLFGFDPAEDGSVAFESETVTLLRIEGFAPGNGKPGDDKVRIDLLDTQRAAKAIEPKPSEEIQAWDQPLRVSRPAAFPDTRARFIEIYAVALSRHANALRTRYDELPEILTEPKAVLSGATKAEQKKAEAAISQVTLDRRWLPATARPARIAHLSSIPSFGWSDNSSAEAKPSANAKLPSVFVSRSVQVRVRAKRPWFSSGEGERLGVVIWPPNLFGLDAARVRQDLIKPLPGDRIEINLRALPDDGTAIRELQDADLGSGGSWVTRWGADPTRALGDVQGWLLSKDNFPGVIEDAAFSDPPHEHPKGAVLVRNVLMPIPVDADAGELRVPQPPGGFMAVSLITYTPRFDADLEMWYVDININPCGAVYPFVRLGLVRYQPNAASGLQVSEPVLEWAQIMPERKLTATAKYTDRTRQQVEVTAIVEGISSGAGNNNGHPESSPSQAPRMYFSLLQRRFQRGDEILSSEIIFDKPQTPEPKCGSPCASWTAVFRMSYEEYRGCTWSVLVEEVDLLRPATYSDEPRYETLKDQDFANTGPRFVARLPLDNLKIM